MGMQEREVGLELPCTALLQNQVPQKTGRKQNLLLQSPYFIQEDIL